MRRFQLVAALLLATFAAPLADAFCGFYVAQEAGSLFNKSSRVVLARDGDHTVLTMANDYKGDPETFGLVVPVPVEILPGTVSVVEPYLVDALHDFSVPRLVEYHDERPCAGPVGSVATGGVLTKQFLQRIPAGRTYQNAVSGVRVEQQFAVEEYAVTVISATNAEGLQRWLVQNGYQVPAGANAVLDSYIRQDMHFFLAKIDLSAQAARGVKWPRPLQVRYKSPKFALPIRLGTVNADGPQDLVVLTLTTDGRVETTNYRSKRVPTDAELPTTIKEAGGFGRFYDAMFERLVRADRMSAVYLEYAWPIQAVRCDPCTGAQVGQDVLTKLGAPGIQQGETFLTRLHVRYDAAHFPEDLVFHETRDRKPWQARYILHHPYDLRPTECPNERHAYLAKVAERETQERWNLEVLTGDQWE